MRRRCKTDYDTAWNALAENAWNVTRELIDAEREEPRRRAGQFLRLRPRHEAEGAQVFSAFALGVPQDEKKITRAPFEEPPALESVDSTDGGAVEGIGDGGTIGLMDEVLGDGQNREPICEDEIDTHRGTEEGWLEFVEWRNARDQHAAKQEHKRALRKAKAHWRKAYEVIQRDIEKGEYTPGSVWLTPEEDHERADREREIDEENANRAYWTASAAYVTRAAEDKRAVTHAFRRQTKARETEQKSQQNDESPSGNDQAHLGATKDVPAEGSSVGGDLEGGSLEGADARGTVIENGAPTDAEGLGSATGAAGDQGGGLDVDELLRTEERGSAETAQQSVVAQIEREDPRYRTPLVPVEEGRKRHARSVAARRSLE
ncbi:hypothetical protein PsYK624_168410 [Phanerochaete sordida]|uniref:Uncharacterized protein n=1 Tax=Phanerochaete sordida TaxID=48140 RepID=A0A9P3GRJ0_9APHY|nr:hypothetical protein PsYK624_168410 [Phanerochaete sordida]